MSLNIMALEIVILLPNLLETRTWLFVDLFTSLYKWDKKEVNDSSLSPFPAVPKIRESGDNALHHTAVVRNIFDVTEFYRMIRRPCLAVTRYLG